MQKRSFLARIHDGRCRQGAAGRPGCYGRVGLMAKGGLLGKLLHVELKEGVEDFSTYPFSIPAVRHLGRLAIDPAVTFLIGENGSGKSTLLEAVAVTLGANPEGILPHEADKTTSPDPTPTAEPVAAAASLGAGT